MATPPVHRFPHTQRHRGSAMVCAQVGNRVRLRAPLRHTVSSRNVRNTCVRACRLIRCPIARGQSSAKALTRPDARE